MTRVTLDLPALLRDSAGGRPRLELEADRLDAACEELRRSWPLLATHLFTDGGKLRPHVLLLHNDDLLPRGSVRDLPLAAGDRLEIVQAVSGG